MKIIPIYLVLFAFWMTQVMQFNLSEIRGLSFMNVCLYLLLFIWGIKGWRRRQFFEPTNLNKSIILMICVALISVVIKILMGDIPNLSLWKEIQDVKNWSNPFFVFFAVFNIIEDEKQCKHALTGLIFLLLSSVVPTLIEAFGIIDFDIIREKQQGRAAGFAEANQYATFLVLFSPMVLSYFLFNHQTKIIWLICFLLVIMGLVLTGSRGGTLSFIVSMVAYLWFIKSQKIIKLVAITRIIVILLIFCTIAYLAAPAQLKELSARRFNPKNYEDIEQFSNSRIPGIRNALVLFLESPLWGHGHKTFTQLVRIRGLSQLNSHNEYLAHLIHYGLIGLFIYLVILTKIFQKMKQLIISTEDPANKVLYSSYLAGFIGYAFSMFFVNLMSPRIIFWFYTAIIYKYSFIEMYNRYEPQNA